MPTDTYSWSWEEAFQTHGFNDRDNPQHNDDVGEFLVPLGWKYETCSSHHNGCIVEIRKGAVHIEFEGHEESDEIRRKLPKEVVAALDAEFQ